MFFSMSERAAGRQMEGQRQVVGRQGRVLGRRRGWNMQGQGTSWCKQLAYGPGLIGFTISTSTLHVHLM